MAKGKPLQEQSIDEIMWRVYERAGRHAELHLSAAETDEQSPLRLLLEPEPRAWGDHTEHERREIIREEMSIASRYLRRFLNWVMAFGPHPRHALQRFFTATNAVAPELMLNMSQEEIAALFGQCRAAESARHRNLEHLLEQVLRPGASFHGDKSTESRAKMTIARRKVVARERRRKARAAGQTLSTQ
jgi:hypothetical protein